MTVIKRPDDEPLFGGKSVIMPGDAIPPAWREGLKKLKDRDRLEKEPKVIVQLLDAALFAAHKHRNQRRKDADASPYINHPLALAHILATTGGITDPITLCAALLHDTVEDTETSFDEIEIRFGERIAAVVREVTDDKNLDKDERKRLQVEKAAGKSPEAKLVKLADKISNLRDILAHPPVDWPNSRKLGYFNWANDVVAGLRGANAAMEAEFDRLLTEGRAQFGEPSA